MGDYVALSQAGNDPASLTDTAVDAINTNLTAQGYPGWTAYDATLAIILLTTIAQMVSDLWTQAGVMSDAAFRAFGTQLLGIPYQNGTYSTVDSTWTFTTPAPAGGYQIAAGTAVIVSGQVFYVQSTYTSQQYDTSAEILLVASQVGILYNGLGGVNMPVSSSDQIDWVGAIVTIGVTSGGADQQDDTSYQNELAQALTVYKLSVCPAGDYPTAVSSPQAQNATGVTVGRATAIDGYYPDGRALSTGGAGSTVLSCVTVTASAAVTLAAPSGNQVPQIGATVTGTGVPGATFTATTSLASPTLTAVSAFTACGVGTHVSGAGIPAGAFVTAINTGAGTATLSVAATVAGTAVTITPTQTVLASPSPTDTTFYISVPASASATNNLTLSALSGYGPTHLACVASTTVTSPTITVITPPYPGAIVDVGARVRGTGIPAGATVLASPAPTVTSFTLSGNATSSNTGETVTVSSWTLVERCVTTFVTDNLGNPLTSAAMDALAAWLDTLREVSFLPFVTAPSYSLIYVTTSIHCLPGYDPTAVAGNVQAALMAYLNPATWGQGQQTTKQWLNSGQGFNVVRFNTLIGLVESVPGVQYVPNGTLTFGFAASPAGVVDIVLPGPAPLPTSSAVSILLPTVI